MIIHIGIEKKAKLERGCREEYWPMGASLIQRYHVREEAKRKPLLIREKKT